MSTLLLRNLRHSPTRLLAKTLILINPASEVLLIHRLSNSSTSPGAHVFPGGVVSLQDTTTSSPDSKSTHQKLCALRKTFEQTGILLTNPPGTQIPPWARAEARRHIHGHVLPFSDFLARHGLSPSTDALHAFTQWITPIDLPRRYASQVFLAFSDELHAPRNDIGIEDFSAQYLTPRECLEAAARGEIVLSPPQFYLLAVLARESGDREKLLRMAQGPFGEAVMEPRILKALEGGRYVLWLGPRGDREWALVVSLPEGWWGDARGLGLVRMSEVSKL